MNDLLDCLQGFRKGGGKVTSSPPSGRKGKGEGPEPPQGGGKVPGPSKNLPLPHPTPGAPRGVKVEKETGLRDRLAEVYQSLEIANQIIVRVKPVADSHAICFSNADLALRSALAERAEKGERYTLFDLYDARMDAGHSWHPFRQKLNETMSWRKVLMDELAALNKELGT